MCDRIWEKLAHTTAIHTFHHHTIAMHITIQAGILVLKVSQVAFAVGCFWGLSNIHECSGVLFMFLSLLDKPKTICKSPYAYDWMIGLAMDLAVLCDMWSWKQYRLMPFGHSQFWWNLCLPLSDYPCTLHPSRSACPGMGYVAEKTI